MGASAKPIESPFPSIQDALQNMVDVMGRLHEEQTKANQQSESTKRIAISTLGVATLAVVIQIAEWVPLLVDWSSWFWNWTTAWMATVFDKG